MPWPRKHEQGRHDTEVPPQFGWTPSIAASNLVEVDIDGNIVDDPLGLGINPAGFTIHSAVHAARADAMCVLHTHTVAGVAVSCQKQGLLPLNQWSLQFTDRLAYHDYEGIALDLDERARLVADLGDQFVMVLRNHGMLTCGRSVAEAFKLMLANKNVKAILVNIFGGIMRCDTIAEGVITACKAVNLNVPLVVRMKGTNEEVGKKMLAQSGLPIISADTMAEAAQKVMAAVASK